MDNFVCTGVSYLVCDFNSFFLLTTTALGVALGVTTLECYDDNTATTLAMEVLDLVEYGV